MNNINKLLITSSFNRIFFCFGISLVFFLPKNYSQITALTSGSWASGSTWVGGVVPADGDEVIVNAPNNVTISTAEIHNANISGTGILNINAAFTINSDILISITTLNNNSNIGGTGLKTYASGTTINNTDGTLSGGNHILSNGATLNANVSISSVPLTISQTTFENHGILNMQTGGLIQGVSTTTIFNNESDGVVNVMTATNNVWQNLHFNNKGSFNKISNTLTTFNTNFGSSSFTNDVGVTINIASSQTINFASNATTLNGTIDNEGTLIFSALCTVNGNVVNNGTWNVNSPPTINAGSTLTGTGTLNVNSNFFVPYDITFTYSIINNNSNIGGTGIKTYPNGILINNTDGTLSGGKHILSNGATLNANVSISSVPLTISQTTFENHGILNMQTGGLIQGVSTTTIFNNESDGVVNVMTATNNVWQNLHFSNKGSFNKISNTVTTFNTNFGSSSFTNDIGVTINIASGQTINFASNATTLNGTIDNEGTLIFSALCTVNGNVVNNGTWNVNSPPTINAGSTLTGTGTLNVNSNFFVPYDITFTYSIINNNSNIGGIGIKTYPNGIIINNTDGTMSGGNHILSNGATLNANVSISSVPLTISQTTFENHGILNMQTGGLIQGVSTTTIFNNESDGVVNVMTATNNVWQNLHFSNKGSFNKISNTLTTFNTNFGSSSFTNDIGVTINIASGQTINFASNATTLNGTIDNEGTLIFSALCTVNGNVVNNGTWNVNSPPTINAGSTLTGTGTLNVNSNFFVPYDITITYSIINNNSNIGGIGIKTYPNGILINNTDGTLSGGKHILSNGATLNANVSISSVPLTISQTTFENHGILNMQTGGLIQGVSTTTIFNNESDGVVNVMTATNNVWQNLHFNNKGSFNKLSNTVTTFNSSFGSGDFINLAGGSINGIGTVLHSNLYNYQLNSQINPGLSPGLITVNSFSNPLNFGQVSYNCEINGTTMVSEYDHLASFSQVDITQMTLNVNWGFTPTLGQSFTIMTHSGIIGEFANINIPSIANYVYKIDYNPTNVILNVFERFYQDFDGDSYGNSDVFQDAATMPMGFVSDSTDCNDNVFLINPATTEVCDGLDNNCDGMVDEGLLSTFYADADMDTYGDAAVTVMACTAPIGYVANDEDCNDANAAINPAAPEVCDLIDNDCDGMTDEGVQITFYADIDMDTYGDALMTTMACAAPMGYVTNDDDCNDAVAAINPAATEVCDLIDNDCDGMTDEGVQLTFYADSDMDTYGDAAVAVMACTAPIGYVANDEDCNDANAAINPATSEVCDLIDNDCDGMTDEGAQITFYADADMDTYGNAAVTVMACTAPMGYVTNDEDCNDAVAAINPAATEVCDLIDNDCDGMTDEGVQITFYADADMDTYGDAAMTIMACTSPIGYVANDDDCNDAVAAINPAASEVCDLIDNDCDGMTDEGVQITFYADADMDTYGDAAVTVMACTAPMGYVTNDDDCNDAVAAINPAASEVCDLIDNDCDGMTDEGVQITFYADTDMDTYGDAAMTIMACTAPIGYVANDDDCNDAVAAINPAASEVCDLIDNDCDGMTDEGVQITFYADADMDTYGDAAVTVMACTAPMGYVTNDDDCNDAVAAINPAASEVCDLIDNNCDGMTDEGVQITFYADADMDTYGDAAVTVMACTAPMGYVTNDEDCNDAVAAINPAASEVCDLIDNNCDGMTDEGVQITFYADADMDTYGDAAVTVMACTAPMGYVTNDEDCNDAVAAINPAASEVCDLIDNDCDGMVDEGLLSTFYADADMDTYGDAAMTIMSCTAPIGYVANDQDCNDAIAAINPAASEVCDGVDNNCDGMIDEGFPAICNGNYQNVQTGIQYSSLQNAIDNASPSLNQTIILLSDNTESTIDINNDVNIEANGYDLTINGTLTIPNGKKLTWKEETLIIHPSGQILNNGTLKNNGIINYQGSTGTFINDGIYTGNGNFQGNFINNGSVIPGN